jgi:hypothetical protein
MTIRSFINLGDALRYVGGINVVLNDGVPDISYCILKRDKNIVRIHASGSRISGFPELNDQLQKHIPSGCEFHLNIEGKAVLEKSIDPSVGDASADQLVKKLFPMINASDFVIQIESTEGNRKLSVLRKEIVVGFFNALPNHTFVSLSLSDVLKKLVGSVVKKNSEEQSGGYTVGEDRVSHDVLGAYISALSLFYKNKNWMIAGVNEFSSAHKTYELHRHLFRASKVAVLSVIGVLLINAISFMTLQSNVQEMESSVEFASTNKERVSEQYKKVSALMTSYNDLGWQSNKLPLFYCDQLASNVTEALTLTSLEVGVLDHEQFRKEKIYRFNPDVIKVQGIANDPLALNNWIQSVEKLYWVEKIYDQKYVHDKRSGKGIFELYIGVK